MSVAQLLDRQVEIRSPSSFPDSPLSRVLRQPMMIGLFLNLQDMQMFSIAGKSTWTFDYNLKVVQRAEELGFDLAFSRTQWLPKGGYDGEASLDSFIALGAMAAATKDILLISTLHVLYGPLHPLHIAKFGATFDHIAKGRWGINIVTGHRAVEHEMFGWTQIEHDNRYELTAELFDVVERLWTDTENFSYEGKSPWKIHNGYITPKPLYGRPILVNATGSSAGIDFAARYSDIVFITSPTGAHILSALESLPAHTAKIKKAAKDIGREIRTLINPIIVSRETEKETADYAEEISALSAAEMRSGQLGKFNYASDAHAWRGRLDPNARKARGLGGNIEIIGTPEQVVDQLVKLKAAGIDGIQIGFHDFVGDLEFFADRILPLMKQAGLRI